jgi:iron complex transport system ATP-binding protein
VTDLLGLADRSFQQLSGGERQRVAVALALAQEPTVLLLDEPTVHLDIAHQMAILALARRLCATRGLTVLAAMHDINLACLYFDRLLVMHDGRILASGPPGAVLSAVLVEQAFGARVAVGRHPTMDVPQVSLLP